MNDDRPAPAEIFSHYLKLLRDEPWLEVAMCWTVVVPHDHRPFPVADAGARVSGGTRHEAHEARRWKRFLTTTESIRCWWNRSDRP